MDVREELQGRMDRAFDLAIFGYLVGGIGYVIAMLLECTVFARSPMAASLGFMASTFITVIFAGGFMVRALVVFALVGRRLKRMEGGTDHGHQH